MARAPRRCTGSCRVAELIPGTVTVGSVGVFVFADFEGPESADS